MVVRLCSTKDGPVHEVMIAADATLTGQPSMNRRHFLCVIVLAVISQLLTGQSNWLINVSQISISISV